MTRIMVILESIFLIKETRPTNMNIESAIMTIEIALEGYVEDCIGRENEEAQKELDKAWTLILNTLNDK